jgi:hypothetical protein
MMCEKHFIAYKIKVLLLRGQTSSDEKTYKLKSWGFRSGPGITQIPEMKIILQIYTEMFNAYGRIIRA